MVTIAQLYNTLAEQKGSSISYDSLLVRPKAKIYSPFLKRYKQAGGELIQDGNATLFQKEKGVEALRNTISHMIDHIQGEITIEIQLVGNNDTVQDVVKYLEQLQQFV